MTPSSGPVVGGAVEVEMAAVWNRGAGRTWGKTGGVDLGAWREVSRCRRGEAVRMEGKGVRCP